MKYLKTLYLFLLYLIFGSLFFNTLYAEDNYELELKGSTILDVCKWAERNTIMHFKINRNLEIYWNELAPAKRADDNIKKSYEQKKISNLDALSKNSKRYHYLSCYEHLKDM